MFGTNEKPSYVLLSYLKITVWKMSNYVDALSYKKAVGTDFQKNYLIIGGLAKNMEC